MRMKMDVIRNNPNQCGCDDCSRKPFRNPTRVPFDKRDLMVSDGGGGYGLLPDHEVLSFCFHDETTTKENDDGGSQWMSNLKNAAIKIKGEGHAADASDVITIDDGPPQLGKKSWGIMQETAISLRLSRWVGPQEGGRLYYGRSGIYFSRK